MEGQGDGMTTLQAIVLGMLQGLGEFLPISSSGHLVVAPWLLGWPDHSLSFDVALHVGTLAAVLYAFYEDWRRLLGAGIRGVVAGRPFADPDSRLLWLLAAATVPGVVAGLLLEDLADSAFRSPALVAGTMASMGLVLLVADRTARGAADARSVTLRDALLIGVAQALALVPGVSRSGATISMGLFLGYRREEAARFSFLLATPITVGAAALKSRYLFEPGHGLELAAGMATAAVFGFASIRFLLAYVRTRDYLPFVYYRLAFAALVVGVLLARGARVG
jgi:undecaprenyl-diphosphatase